MQPKPDPTWYDNLESEMRPFSLIEKLCVAVIGVLCIGFALVVTLFLAARIVYRVPESIYQATARRKAFRAL